MKTVNTAYLGDLDLLRGFASSAVLCWHYFHFDSDQGTVSSIPGLALFQQGHVGVSLFMVLSGFLFARIIHRVTINWYDFYRNRILRIFPLLVVTQIFWVICDALGFVDYSWLMLASGFVLPVWAGGAWSIAVELHFYLLLPLICRIFYLDLKIVAGVLLAIIILRAALFTDAPDLSYTTIIGRIDQFLIGYALFLYGDRLPRWAYMACFAAFFAYMELFNAGGGLEAFKAGDNGFVSPLVPHWFLEGLGFAALMNLVMGWTSPIKQGRLWRAGEYVGKISYSIYLWHYILLVLLAFVVRQWDLSVAMYLALFPLYLLVVLAVSSASYHYIEMPFLKFRIRYVRNAG